MENNTAILLKKVSSDVRLMVDNAVMPFAEVVSRGISCLFLVATLLLVDFRVAIGAALVLGLFYAAVFGFLRSWRGRTSYALREADRGAMLCGPTTRANPQAGRFSGLTSCGSVVKFRSPHSAFFTLHSLFPPGSHGVTEARGLGAGKTAYGLRI